MVKREACGAFTLTDDTGTAVIKGPFLIELDFDDCAVAKVPPHGARANLPPAVYSLLEEARMGWVWSWERIRYQEGLLKPGDLLSVLGRASLEIDPAGRGSYWEPSMLHHIKGSEGEPVIIVDEGDRSA